MKTYYVYSDVSYRFGVLATAVVVQELDHEAHVYRVTFKKSEVLNHDSNVRAELHAMASGLQHVPRDAAVYSYYDLNDLPLMLDSRVSYQDTLEPELSHLRRLMNSRKTSLVRASKKETHYMHCHRLARAVAKTVAFL